jgi:hypothetical protein
MDWGGVIAGAVGGLSNSVGSIADDQIKANARAKEMEMQEQRTIAGEQRRALLQREQFEFEANKKLQMQKEAEEKNAATQIKAEEAAGGIGDERRFAKFKADLGKTDATDEQLREIFKSQYDSKKLMVADKVEAPYVDKGSDRAGDVVTALKQQGASSGLIKSAMDAQRMQLGDEQKAADFALKERRQTETERSNEAREDLRLKQISAAIAKSNGGGSGSKEALAYLSQERLSLTADKQDLRAREETALKGLTSKRKDEAKLKFDEANAELIASIRERSKFLDSSLTKVRDQVGLGSSDKPTDAPKPAADKGKPAAAKELTYDPKTRTFK